MTEGEKQSQKKKEQNRVSLWCASLSVLEASHGSDGGRESARERFSRLSEFFRFGAEERRDVLESSGCLKAQGVHHVAQVIWERERNGALIQEKKKPNQTRSILNQHDALIILRGLFPPISS